MSVGTAVFSAVGRFGGLIGPAKAASTALDDVAKKGRSIGDSVPANGGNTGSGLSAIGKRAGELSQKMDKTGKSLTTGVTLPLAAVGAVAVKSFSDFEVAIVSAGQKSGATGDQLARMKQLAIDMGASTKFNAQDAATALDNLAAMGFNAEDSMSALPGVMLAAQAANEDLGLTAEVTASSLNAFDLKASDASHVADVLSQSANMTSLSMQDLADGIANAGEVGPRFGQSLESVTAMLGRLRDMGVPAASAGTAIRQSLVSLSAPTKKAAGYMEEVGFATRDAHGKMLPIPTLLKNFETAFASTNPKFVQAAKDAKMTGNEYRDYATKAIFGVEGAKAFALAVSDGHPTMIDAAKDADSMKKLQDGLAKTMGGPAAAAWIKARTENGKFVATGADAVTAITAMNTAADGTAEKFGKAFNETTSAKIDQMWGSVQSLGLAVMDVLAPALKDVIDNITGVIAKIGEFAKAHPQIVKIGTAFLLAAAALGPILIAIAKVVSAVGTITSALGKVGTAMSWAFGAGAEGQASRFVRLFDGVRLKIGQVGTAVGTAARSFGTMIAAGARAAISMAMNAARIVAGWVLMGVQATINAAKIALAWTVGIIRQAAVAGLAMATTVARVVAGWVLMGVQSMIQAARMAAAWLIAMGPVGWIIAAVVALVALIIANWDKVKTWTIAAWNAIVGWLKTAWEWIKTTVAAGASWVAARLSAIWNGIRGVVIAVWSGIRAFLAGLWAGIRGNASAVWNGIRSTIASILNGIRSVMSSVWNGIRSLVSGIWNGMRSTASSVFNGIKSTISGIVNGIKSTIVNGINAAKSGWSAAWNAIRSVASGAINGVKGVVDSVVGGIRSSIESVMSKINGVKNAASNVTGAIGGFLGFSTGGLVPGSGSGDTVPAMLEPGEFVLRRAVVRRIGAARLVALNRMGGGPAPLDRTEYAKFKKVSMGGALRAMSLSERALAANQSRVPVAVGAGAAPVASKVDNSQTNIVTNVYNPVPEKASDSVQQRLTRTAQLGLIGGRK